MFEQTCPFILASASPRRKAFLRDLALSFTTRPAVIDETPHQGEAPESFARRMAREKAQALAANHPESCIIGADTVVTLEQRIFGKPETAAEAVTILKTLRNRSHEVITGVALIQRQRRIEHVFSVRTQVCFADFPDQLLRAYVASGDPMDKAGAYGIQTMGGLLVESIHGSYSNVVGLPMCQLIRELVDAELLLPKPE
ncbi:Maf family protein [Desulfogranum mediterraneum]|uniref:Maf family protein n=1 Tax=Desulfogranum mediterraneum TaxID=160661 RepID=UPI000407FDB8|nr:Maf family protein [Desulfogranum mediterraneum]